MGERNLSAEAGRGQDGPGEALDVYLHANHVGVLHQDKKGWMRFAYLPEYVKEAAAERLSWRMPVREEPYGNEECDHFFSNLLPDEGARWRIAEVLGVAPEDTFALLKALGGDCAGAVSLFPRGVSPASPMEPIYKELAENETKAILERLARNPLDAGVAGYRISGAGAQDKLVAAVVGGKVFLPLYGTPSTHIIKPGIPLFPESVHNECFCMRLAERCGLRVAKCSILDAGGTPYYATERYDRRKVGVTADGKARWERLHQEDFCQLLGFAPWKKYESQGGPSMADCFKLLHDVGRDDEAAEAFDRVMFTFLIGNGDAHAKNWSLLYRDGKPELAPMYDALSTTVYDNLDKKMAMKVDGRYDFKGMTVGKFTRQGTKMGLPPDAVIDSVQRMCSAVNRNLDTLAREMAADHPASIYEAIRNETKKRAIQLQNSLTKTTYKAAIRESTASDSLADGVIDELLPRNEAQKDAPETGKDEAQGQGWSR